MNQTQHDALVHITAELGRRGRSFQVQRDHLVLDSRVGQHAGDLAYAYAQSLAHAGRPEFAAHQVVEVLLAREARVLAEGAELAVDRVRLRLTHPDQLDPVGTLPGPADLRVYPVQDTPDEAHRLSVAQIDALGGLERVGVGALGATLAEPLGDVVAGSIAACPGWLISGDIYTASRILDTPRLLAELGVPAQAPMLVGAPCSRELILVRPPGSLPVAVVDEAAQRIRWAYEAARGAISPWPYLWTGSELIRPDRATSGHRPPGRLPAA